jgi:hypothetical protein
MIAIVVNMNRTIFYIFSKSIHVKHRCAFEKNLRQSGIKILIRSRSIKMMRPRSSWCRFETCFYVEHQFEAGAVGAAKFNGSGSTP